MFTKERGYEGYFIDYHGDDAGYRRFHQQYGTDAGRTDICRNVLHNGLIVVLYVCPVV